MLKQVRAATLMEGRGNSHRDYSDLVAIYKFKYFCKVGTAWGRIGDTTST